MCAAHRVRQVCRKIYGGKCATLAALHASTCRPFSVDCSALPLAVSAGKTHSAESAAWRRASRIAAAGSLRGIARRPDGVLLATCSAPSRT